MTDWKFPCDVIEEARELSIGDRVVVHWVEAECPDQEGTVVGVGIEPFGKVRYTFFIDGDQAPTSDLTYDVSGRDPGSIHLLSYYKPVVEAAATAKGDKSRDRFYYPIVMPINADGQGPADLKEATELTWEVWDQELNTHASFPYLLDAIDEAERLNGMLAAAPSSSVRPGDDHDDIERAYGAYLFRRGEGASEGDAFFAALRMKSGVENKEAGKSDAASNAKPEAGIVDWGAIPNAQTDGAHPVNVLAGVLACAESWQPEARIIGNVRAGDIARAIRSFPPNVLTSLNAGGDGCVHNCDEGGVCLAELSGYPESCLDAAVKD